MGASPGCCQVRQKGFKDYLQAHGRVKLQTTLAIYNHHRESFFFFFSIASAQEAAVMIFFKISAE